VRTIDTGPTWHIDTIRLLSQLLYADNDVIALALYGSALRPEDLDAWSDIDALIVVRNGTMSRFFPSTDWLEPLGGIFAREQYAGSDTNTTRLCFEDLRKLDLVFATASSLREIDAWPRVPFAGGLDIRFTRDPQLTRRLEQPFPAPHYTPPPAETFETLVSSFWFRAMVAVAKVARNDLVIGLHLALGLLQDACVLAMMLRDRAEGTDVHRTGGKANETVATFADVLRPATVEGVLDLIEASGRTFDHLAGEWSTEYQTRLIALSVAVARARAARGR
jgi:predicted nucleotidyltransferase